MKKIKLFIIGIASIFLLISEASFAQPGNGTPGFLVTTGTNIAFVDLNGTTSTFLSSGGHVEIYNDKIFILSGGIKVYDFQGQIIKTITIPIQVSSYINFVVLPDLSFALLDNDDDKIYFIDYNGTYLNTVNILNHDEGHNQNLDGVVVGNSLIISENGIKQILKVDLSNYQVSVFRDFSYFTYWLGAIDYSAGKCFICQAQTIYSFIDGQPVNIICTLPEGNISGISVVNNYAYVTINQTGEVYKVNLSSGEYTLFAQGFSYPEDIEGINVPANAPCPVLSFTGTMVTNVSCFGGNNGEINLSVMGGTIPYTFSWNDGATTEDRVNLTAGNYSVTVTDAFGCPGTASMSITEPAQPLAAVITAQTNVLCYGNATGSATAIASGGIGPYLSFTWNTNPVQTTNTAVSLTAGTYAVTVVDSNLCSATTSVTINQPPALVTSTSVSDITCNQCTDASIDLTINGGVPGSSGGSGPGPEPEPIYSIVWTGPDDYSATTEDISSLKPGSYSALVTDNNNCSVTVNVDILNPFKVTNPGDVDEIGTLRYAINYANSHNSTTTDLITFDIPNGLPTKIQPLSPLPTITAPLVIDGFSQPGASESNSIHLIELDGTNAGTDANGLTINADNCTIKGLVINKFYNGISIASDGNIVSGNYIGTDITGKIGIGNGSWDEPNNKGNGAGISLYLSNNNRIGGSSLAERNLISANPNVGIWIIGYYDNVTKTYYKSSGNLIKGNLIGTDIDGVADLGNRCGIEIDTSINNAIGGLTPGERNIISGNLYGIRIAGGDQSKGNSITGNYIGTNITGTAALSNNFGIVLYASETTIGGSTPGARNIISGSPNQGLAISGGLAHQGPSSGNIIKGNYIGVDATGNLAIPNGFGIMIMNSGSNQIGGDLVTEGNLISGNTRVGLYVGYQDAINNRIEGNMVGTTADGKSALGNGIGQLDQFGYGGININGPGNIIGSSEPQKRNIISGNLTGLSLRDTANNCIVLGNFIGTDITGTKAIPNINNGIAIKGGKDNTIGSSLTNARNIISGNSKHGIFLTLSDVFPTVGNPPLISSGNLIQGNYIGTDVTGIEHLGNSSSGVYLGESANNNVIGGTEIANGNLIAYNGASGIICAGEVNPGTGNSILSNSIYSNTGIGIDLGGNGITSNDAGDGDLGANNLQNYPKIESVSFSPGFVTVKGSLDSPVTTNNDYTLQFFANKIKDDSGYGEGQYYLGSGSFNAADKFAFTFPIKGIYGQVISATATDVDGNTSEFSKITGGLADQVVGFTWPIRYVYNASGAEKITNGTDITAITNSFQTWSNISTAKTKFESAGPTDMANAVAGDGINLVSFMDTEYDWPDGVLAYASKTTQMDEGGVSGKIIDADIIVNPAFKDVLIGTTGVNGETGTPGFYDIQSIITHEIGHILGLLHSGLTRSTMFFWMHKESIGKRTLESDDIAWASYKYPESTFSSTYGTITGNITYGYGGYPVAGALVTAKNTLNGISFHSYSDADGNYVIPVLSSGSNQYYIHIQPLDGDVDGYPMTPANISSYIYSNTVYTDYPDEYFNTGDTDGRKVNGSFTDDEIKKDPLSVSGVGNIITNKDLTPPQVVSITPDDGSVVKVLPDIIITFSEPVDLTSFTDDSCYLDGKVEGKPVQCFGDVSQWEGNTVSVIFTPEKNLPNSALLTLHLKGITDLKGNALFPEYQAYSITTIDPDIVPPRVTSSIPGNGDEGVFVTDKIIVSFSEPMNKTSVQNYFTFRSGGPGDVGGADVGCTLSWGDNGSTVTFDPDDPLLEGTRYTLKLSKDIKDINDVSLFIPIGQNDPPDKDSVEVSFMTVKDGNPTTTYIGPGANAFDVPVNTPVVIDFSEPIITSIFDPDSLDYNPESFKLQVKDGASVSGSYEVLKEDSRVVFRPNIDLSFGTTYEIMLTASIKDKDGNSLVLEGKFPSAFTTSTIPSGPSIEYIEKPTGVANDKVTISGKGFDPDPTKNLVSFAGTTATVESATLTSLEVAVPTGTVSGLVTVSVKKSTSEGFPFYIIKPSNVLPDAWGTSNSNIGNGTHSTDLNGDCTLAFVTNSGSNTVSVVDIDDEGKLTWLYDIPVGEIPMDIAINSTDTRAYVTNYGSNTVSVIDLTTVTHTANSNDVDVKEINVGINPYGIAIVPDGDFVYVANYTSQNLSVIDVNPNSGGFDHAVSNVDLGSGGKGGDVSGDAGLVLVATDDGLKIVNINPQSKEFDCFNCVVESASSGTKMTNVDVMGDATFAIATTEDGRLLIIDVLPGSDYFGTAVAGTSSSSPITSGSNAGDGLHIYATTENHDLLIFEIIPGGIGVPGVEGSYTGVVNLKLVGKKPGIGNDAAVVDALNQRLFTADSKLNLSGYSDGKLYSTGLYAPPQAPQDRIAGLIQNVVELMYGSLKRARGNELIGYLNSAIVYVNNQKNKDAINRLNTFIVKLKDRINSHSFLYPDENEKALDMINTAYEIIAQLKGTKSGDEELTFTEVETQLNQDIITETKLGVIYPNPTREAITINYEVAADEMNEGRVTINIYDISGKLVGNLVNRTQESGRYSVVWKGIYDNGKTAPYGTYFILFRAGGLEEVKEVILLK